MVNKKVKNATPLVYNEIKFKSKLEVFCYKALQDAGIDPVYESNTYVLIDKFEYDGYEYPKPKTKKHREITYTPDFVIDKNIIIECKGFSNDVFPIKWKLFKRYLQTYYQTSYIFLTRNQKQVLESIEQIKILLNERKNIRNA